MSEYYTQDEELTQEEIETLRGITHIDVGRDDPKITVLEEGPGTLIRVLVEYMPEQRERFRKRPEFGYRIPFYDHKDR
jgi:hypothetical protein